MPLRVGESSFTVGDAEPVTFMYEYDSAVYVKLLTPAALDALTAGEDLGRFVRRLGLGAARKDFSLPLVPPAERVRIEDDGHARLLLSWGTGGRRSAVFELGDLGDPLRLAGRTFGSVEVVILTGPDAPWFGGQVEYLAPTTGQSIKLR